MSNEKLMEIVANQNISTNNNNNDCNSKLKSNYANISSIINNGSFGVNNSKLEPISCIVKIKQIEKDISERINYIVSSDRLYFQNPNTLEYKSYFFNSIIDNDDNPILLFNKSCKNQVDYFIEGINCSVFAHGIIESGKTITLFGVNKDRLFNALSNNSLSNLNFSLIDDSNSIGIFELTLSEIFIQLFKKGYNNITSKNMTLGNEYLNSNSSSCKFATTSTLSISMVEIYNERILDLLNYKQDITLREINNIIILEDIVEQKISSIYDAKVIVKQGLKNKHSKDKSHIVVILKLIIENEYKSSKSMFYFVDLASSDKNVKLDNLESNACKEIGYINKSLLVVSQVTKQLITEEGKGFVSYRDSKLTHMLKDSLGGNAKTCFIFSLISDKRFYSDSLACLNLAQNVALVRNHLHYGVNETKKYTLEDENYLLKQENFRLKNEFNEIKKTNFTEKRNSYDNNYSIDLKNDIRNIKIENYSDFEKFDRKNKKKVIEETQDIKYLIQLHNEKLKNLMNKSKPKYPSEIPVKNIVNSFQNQNSNNLVNQNLNSHLNLNTTNLSIVAKDIQNNVYSVNQNQNEKKLINDSVVIESKITNITDNTTNHSYNLMPVNINKHSNNKGNNNNSFNFDKSKETIDYDNGNSSLVHHLVNQLKSKEEIISSQNNSIVEMESVNKFLTLKNAMLNEEIEKLNDQIAREKNQNKNPLEEMEKSIKDYEIEMLKQKISELSQKINELKTEIEENSDKNEICRNELEHVRQKEKENHIQLERKNNYIENLLNQIDQINMALSQKNQSFTDFKYNENIIVEMYKSQLEEYIDKIKNLEEKSNFEHYFIIKTKALLNDYEIERKILNDTIKDIINKLSSTTNELEISNDKIFYLKEENKRVKQENNQLKNNYDFLLLDLDNKKEGIAYCKKLKEENNQLKADLEKLTKSSKNLSGLLKMLKSKENPFGSQLSFQSKKKGIIENGSFINQGKAEHNNTNSSQLNINIIDVKSNLKRRSLSETDKNDLNLSILTNTNIKPINNDLDYNNFPEAIDVDNTFVHNIKDDNNCENCSNKTNININNQNTNVVKNIENVNSKIKSTLNIKSNVNNKLIQNNKFSMNNFHNKISKINHTPVNNIHNNYTGRSNTNVNINRNDSKNHQTLTSSSFNSKNNYRSKDANSSIISSSNKKIQNLTYKNVSNRKTIDLLEIIEFNKIRIKSLEEAIYECISLIKTEINKEEENNSNSDLAISGIPLNDQITFYVNKIIRIYRFKLSKITYNEFDPNISSKNEYFIDKIKTLNEIDNNLSDLSGIKNITPNKKIDNCSIVYNQNPNTSNNFANLIEKSNAKSQNILQGIFEN